MLAALDRVKLNEVRLITEGPGVGRAGWVKEAFVTAFGVVYAVLDLGDEEITTRAVNTEVVHD